MNIRTVKYDQLTADEAAAWSTIQRAEPALASPYFRPEFTQAVAAVRGNVEIGVLEKAGRPYGFFPYERTRRGRGLPVGTRLSDFHGVIAGRHLDYDPNELLRGCGLSSWRFDHLLSSQASFAPFAFRHADSPYVDLSRGFEEYEPTLNGHFRADLRRTRRKLEREIGPLRFELDARDPSILPTLLAWKSEQYERTKVLNVLGIAWVRNVLDEILQHRGDDFSAVMPVLYAGDKIMAAAYLLRSGNVLHSWFPAYNRDAARYSPGMHLHMEILRAAPSLGITRFEMGKGDDDYKRILQNGASQVSEGVIDLSLLRAGARSAWWAVRGGVRSTPLHKLVKRPARTVYQLRRWMDLQ